MLWGQQGNEHIKKHPKENILKLQFSLGNSKVSFRYVSDLEIEIHQKKEKANMMFYYPLLPPFPLYPLLHPVQHWKLQKQSVSSMSQTQWNLKK